MSEALAKKMIVLMSSDGETFEVEESVAVLSKTIKHMIEDDCADTAIPLPNVTSDILTRVIEYCKKHVDVIDSDVDKKSDHADEVKKFDEDFVKVDLEMLFSLLLAANYLDINSLLDLTCQTVADYIKDKTVEEVRWIFNIENDFTEEEEAEVRKENAWAFE